MVDVAIIGCGIVGAAAAYELGKYQISAVVLEKENDVACGTSRANSAILHAGYDPHPGTQMAKLNVEGATLAKELCEKLHVPYRGCGSLVLAFQESELETLQTLYARGNQNGVPGLVILSAAEVREMEPNLSESVIAALYAPSGAIVSPWEYTLALAQTAVQNGVEVRLDSGVTAIRKIDGGWELDTETGTIQARYVLNAAGVHADTIHNMVSPPAFSIVPDRGEYYLLDKCEGGRVSRVIFQCPTKIGKGTLVAPTVHGNLIVGPNNLETGDVENVSNTREGLDQVAELARKSVPSVNLRESIRNFAGVRAASQIDDFIIGEAEGAPGFIDLAGIKSPGLTAAPAIARVACELLAQSGLSLPRKDSFIDHRETVRFAELSADERAKLVQENPAYGRIVCRCETVTEGEILDALKSPLPPRTVDGVKRRCGAGMGRCQGGFCGPRIVELLAQTYGVSPVDILQDTAGSFILTGETKQQEGNAS